jgi:NAD(P)-dependent dehydrogenase (short-subunit alcohol dehydrogenase family)
MSRGRLKRSAKDLDVLRIFIGSIGGLIPYARGGAYAASKAAMITLTKVLALEVGAYGVRLNCILCGSIRQRGTT